MVHNFEIVGGSVGKKKQPPTGSVVGSDAALPGLVVCEERVQLREVHNHSVPLVQIQFFEMVFIALVLGEIYKHLQKEGGRERVRRGRDARSASVPGGGPELTWSRVVWETE